MEFTPTFRDALHAAEAEMARIDFDALKRANLYRDPLDYYLLATYPPIKAMRPITPEEIFSSNEGLYRVYLHIPFCEQYCTFCHYTKEINPKAGRVARYLECLHKEFDLMAGTLGKDIDAYSVFFGGGTPSYLEPAQLEELFTHLWSILKLQPESEIIFEMHPGVIRRPDYVDRIKVLKSFGVTRWVFGVQSMDEKVLQKLNRGHGREEVYKLLDILAENGCTDVSVDLIYGLPYQTLENWYDSIKCLVEAGVEKFNIFPLMFKASDPISLHYRKEPEIFPDRRERLLMHLMGDHILNAQGFKKGPIQYYSKGEHRYPSLAELDEKNSKEQVESLSLLPFGVSGFGYVNSTQYFNHCDMNEYMRLVSEGQLPTWLGYRLSLEERMRRAVMFNLRSRGISRKGFSKRFGIDPISQFPEEFSLLHDLQLVEITDQQITFSWKGEIDASGMASIFCSVDVRERIRAANTTIIKSRGNLLEMHDFSPIEHKGAKAAPADASPAASLPLD